MGITQTAKEELIFEIEQLSNPHIAELQSFVRYLKFKQSANAVSSNAGPVLQPDKDPILHGIGMLDAAPFSEAIDDILYGAT